MGYVENLLAENEEVVYTTRDHWIVLLTVFLIDAAVSIVIIGLTVLGTMFAPPWPAVGGVLLIVPLGHFLLRVWKWWNRQYIVTTRRIISVEGNVNKRVSDTSLDKINDIILEQSGLGRLLNFGEIEIISGSERGIDLYHRIANPIEFKKAMLNQGSVRSDRGTGEDTAT